MTFQGDVELFPMRAAIPDTMQEVLDRMTQLRYTSRLALDQKLFKKIGGMIELLQRIDDELPPGSTVRETPPMSSCASTGRSTGSTWYG